MIAIILIVCVGNAPYYPVPVGAWIMTGIIAIGAILTGTLQCISVVTASMIKQSSMLLLVSILFMPAIYVYTNIKCLSICSLRQTMHPPLALVLICIQLFLVHCLNPHNGLSVPCRNCRLGGNELAVLIEALGFPNVMCKFDHCLLVVWVVIPSEVDWHWCITLNVHMIPWTHNEIWQESTLCISSCTMGINMGQKKGGILCLNQIAPEAK